MQKLDNFFVDAYPRLLKICRARRGWNGEAQDVLHEAYVISAGRGYWHPRMLSEAARNLGVYERPIPAIKVWVNGPNRRLRKAAALVLGGEPAETACRKAGANLADFERVRFYTAPAPEMAQAQAPHGTDPRIDGIALSAPRAVGEVIGLVRQGWLIPAACNEVGIGYSAFLTACRAAASGQLPLPLGGGDHE